MSLLLLLCVHYSWQKLKIRRLESLTIKIQNWNILSLPQFQRFSPQLCICRSSPLSLFRRLMRTPQTRNLDLLPLLIRLFLLILWNLLTIITLDFLTTKTLIKALSILMYIAKNLKRFMFWANSVIYIAIHFYVG